MHKFVIGCRYGVNDGHPLLLPIVQSELHPSPDTLLPSSHSYGTTVILSPQIGLHLLPNVLILLSISIFT